MSATEFLARHRKGPGFIMPNAWDAGSALVLASAGFEAIGTTSAGIVFSLGWQDYAVGDESLRLTRDAMFARLRKIVNAVAVPVNADLEAGFGDTPETVAETVSMAIVMGLAGCNIEDRIPGVEALYDETLAVERIAAAREAIDASGVDFVLTARSDAIIFDTAGIAAAIRRSNRYWQAGADCLFTPGVSNLPSVTRLADEIEGPLNMVLGLGTIEGSAPEWIAAGVRRVSVGGSIARAALGLVRQAAEELLTDGTVAYAAAQIPQDRLNAMFAQRLISGARDGRR